MLFALSGANCFSVAQNTHPVLFIMMILSCNSVAGACYSNTVVSLPVWYFSTHSFCFSLSLNHCYFDLILSHLPFLHLSSPFEPFSPTFPPLPFLPACLLSYCFSISWLASHFPFSFLLLFSPFHSCSSLLLCASLSFIFLSFCFAPLSPAHFTLSSV